jgi:hypothetical protein
MLPAILTESPSVAALPDYIAQIKALTAEQIPPGCAADLVAIAEALIAQAQ